MISDQEIQHIAKLARIALTKEETTKFQRDLGSVLEYFEMLKEIDVSGAEAMTHAVSLQNVTREDQESPKNARSAERLMEMAPETKDGYVKVKPIL